MLPVGFFLREADYHSSQVLSILISLTDGPAKGNVFKAEGGLCPPSRAGGDFAHAVALSNMVATTAVAFLSPASVRWAWRRVSLMFWCPNIGEARPPWQPFSRTCAGGRGCGGSRPPHADLPCPRGYAVPGGEDVLARGGISEYLSRLGCCPGHFSARQHTLDREKCLSPTSGEKKRSPATD